MLLIGNRPRSNSLIFNIGSNSTIDIGNNCFINSLEIYTQNDSIVKIGDWTGFTHKTNIACHEPKNVDIGSGCLIASGTLISVSDMHSIIDLETGERINYGSDIFIGEHVWIGAEAYVLKGAKIGKGSIVGARSIVTGEIPENSLAVGSPARVVKRGVSWKHEL